MTRYQKIEAEKKICQMSRQKIINQGFFDWYVNYSRMIVRIAYETNLSHTFVKRVFHKKFLPNSKELLDFYEC
nr:MAG TPA: hypothetical protein [Caudoviricetes sp.]